VDEVRCCQHNIIIACVQPFLPKEPFHSHQLPELEACSSSNGACYGTVLKLYFLVVHIMYMEILFCSVSACAVVCAVVRDLWSCSYYRTYTLILRFFLK
jgi:hypothetical protein